MTSQLFPLTAEIWWQSQPAVYECTKVLTVADSNQTVVCIACTGIKPYFSELEQKELADKGFGTQHHRRLMKPRPLFCTHEESHTAFLRNVFFSSIRQCRMSKECLLEATLTFWRLKVINVLFCLEDSLFPKTVTFVGKFWFRFWLRVVCEWMGRLRDDNDKENRRTARKPCPSAKHHIDWIRMETGIPQ